MDTRIYAALIQRPGANGENVLIAGGCGTLITSVMGITAGFGFVLFMASTSRY